MSATETGDLSSRLDAVIDEARGRARAFQAEAESTRQTIRGRFETFLSVADRIVAMTREKLGRLTERVAFDVKPSHVQTERFYCRSVALDVKSGNFHPIYGMGRHNHENSVPVPGLDDLFILSGDDEQGDERPELVRRIGLRQEADTRAVQNGQALPTSRKSTYPALKSGEFISTSMCPASMVTTFHSRPAISTVLPPRTSS